ncbi:hypothetical protein VMCG_03755 [Cytospora schulzeri]|uniref:DNA2/NAM7 helicase-like C-terminal domain-containing protein n=1 Tax=Cytospora schulzeri TaxID=448051 RepID=A0A423WUI7_9PEZI|nr:hypothetical protein VMCG_03755 [Valsa malicola]
MAHRRSGQWKNFTAWVGDGSGDESKHDRHKKLPPVTPLAPIYTFNNINEFVLRHRLGTKVEFEYESLTVRRFNSARHKFKAWPIMVLRSHREEADVLFFVEGGSNDALLPKEDEVCEMEIPGYGLRLATRRENPCSSWKIRHDFWEHCLVFEVTLPYYKALEPAKGFQYIHPHFRGPQSVRNGEPLPQPLSNPPEEVSFQLRLSTSTKDAELGALETLMSARELKPAGWYDQVKAFEYVMTFKGPARERNLFMLFPHMRDPILKPETVPSKLAERFQNLNAKQMDAYKNLLSNIPVGICVLPGGPGAGKTHLNLTIAAAMLLKDELILPGGTSPQPSRNKVLFLLDINKPLTDIANKMHQLCGELGLTRKAPDESEIPRLVIRMFCWSYETTSVTRGRLEAEREELLRGNPHDKAGMGNNQDASDGPLSRYRAESDKTERVQIHKFSNAFRKAEQPLDEGVAPTLDQAAKLWYEKHKHTKYTNLRKVYNLKNSRGYENLLEDEIEQVYRDVLRVADVVVTTPVTASKFSKDLGSCFKPRLVIFDEAPHARELSTLIAIAEFRPAAWLFTGDHRQTKPWVGSHGKKPAINRGVHQLRVSMMERAHVANPKMPSLLINHRAHGNLQMLGSKLFYGGEMVPAKDPGDLPPSSLHLRQNYIMPLKGKTGSEVSRLIVILKGIGAPVQVQTSWYHPKHQQWTMELVSKLLRDRQFLQTNGRDPGSILIMSPYKQAFQEYRKAIKELKKKEPDLEKHVVEPRTVGTAQGHEADFVILDLVRNRITDHLEDPNRLCVSLTRARQAEIILMHEKMATKLRDDLEFRSGPLAKMLSLCKDAGEYVYDPPALCSVGPPRGVPAPAPRTARPSVQALESLREAAEHSRSSTERSSNSSHQNQTDDTAEKMPFFWSKGFGGRHFGTNVTADRHGVRRGPWRLTLGKFNCFR